MARRTLIDKRVILTGASSGIGWHLALQLAAAGARLVCCARREDRLIDLKNQIRKAHPNSESKVQIVIGDITDTSIRNQLIRSAVESYGGIDLVINNAGVGAMGRFDEASPERLRQIFEVNFFAAVELIRESLPHLRQGREPMIVNISSVLGHRGAPLKSEYCASKFAMHGFSDSLRAELFRDRIDVLLVSPSTTDSEFFESTIEDKTRKNWRSRGAMPPGQVAAKTIKAIQQGKQEIILSLGGKMLVWLDRLSPSLANRILARFGN